ncbi:MAG TPA: S53 family serine peptidase [Solirubrobacteraceae bacterium]|jgi:kumamolisin|nr:S53 family serine peptidase [Solirubrobacteraceae bacterium]
MSMKSWGWRQTAARGAVLAAACGCASSVTAVGAGPAAAGVTWVGAAPGNGTITLALPLKADDARLSRFAAAVSTPGSAQYGQYASVPALARRFGASAGTRARVLRYLRAAGATSVKIDVTGLFADATMKVAQAQRLFGTSLADYRTARATRYMAPSSPTRIPAGLRSVVAGVVGLNTRPLFGTPQAMAPSSARWPRVAGAASTEHPADESGYPQRTGAAAGCSAAASQSGFTPNQYLTAYGYAPLQAAGLRGQGERVALIEIDGFKYSDVRRFASCFGLSIPAINGYGVGLRRPLPPGGESTLDLEVLDAAAPRLKAVDVYESRPSAVDVLRSLTAPLSNSASKPDVISASLGSCEPATLQTMGSSGLRTVENSLALAAASGISVLASSGDDGSSACLDPSGQPLPGLAVSFPASSPWVTGVGGTNVSLNAANQIISQEVWNDSPLVIAAGGGGLSDLFRRPNYQNGSVLVNHRAVPDVSMLADVAPGYEIYCTASSDCVTNKHSSPWTQVGGTSAASPLLAGGLALIDQDLRVHRQQDIGLANPLLYKADHLPQGPTAISDIVTNNNDLGQSIAGHPFGCCSAELGFDYASGLGSVNVGGLAAIAQTVIPKVVAVGLTVPRQRHPVASGHLLARISCSGRCLLGAYTRIQLGRSRKRITSQSRAYLLRRAGRKTVKVSFDATTLSKLRWALARRERVTATVYGAVLDPAGVIEAQTQGLALRIRG